MLPANKRFLELGPGPQLWAVAGNPTEFHCGAAVLELDNTTLLSTVKAETELADTLLCISVGSVGEAEAAMLAGADIIRDITGGDCLEFCREIPYVCVNPRSLDHLGFNALVETSSRATLHPSVVTLSPGPSASEVRSLLSHADFVRSTEVERTQQLLS